MVSFTAFANWRRSVLFVIPWLLLLGSVSAETPEGSSTQKSRETSGGTNLQTESGHEFTPWMSLSELNAYLESLDGDKPDGKNFWDRGNWIDKVEGRWEAGIPQYRISHSAVPERRASWWFWYLNQDRESFDRLVHQLADEGFTLVHYNSYERPGGSVRFQGVWHKLIPLTHAALLPAGHYQLSEIQGRKLTEPVVSLTIEGERISGHGPLHEFKGSARDRFSGTITATEIAKPTLRTVKDADVERDFLKLLENCNWKEEQGKIRVVKDGRTILRFERDEKSADAVPPKE